jgi:hypothetical protein
VVVYSLQVLAENHINVPGLAITFTDPDTCGCCCSSATHVVVYSLQVLAENHINVPGLAITFTDSDSLALSEDSKAALSLVPYKPAAEVPFGAWDTPGGLVTPAGQLSNVVPVDRLGAARAASNDLPGACPASILIFFEIIKVLALCQTAAMHVFCCVQAGSRQCTGPVAYSDMHDKHDTEVFAYSMGCV